MTGLPADAERTKPSGERFDPASMGGHLIEAEHMVRYLWAAQFASGRRVLDAACGMGYGTIALLDSGAVEVVGVDRDEEVVRSVAAAAPTGARFDVGDLLSLPYDDDEFDFAVCFEAIEHVDDPDRVLDELRRVLRPDGLLAISTPNRDVYLPGNPFHLRELTPSEFDERLVERFRNVSLRRQHTWIASAVLDDQAFAAGGQRQLPDVKVHKAAGQETGAETYTVALASDAELPPGEAALSLTSDIDIRDWSERLERAARLEAAVPLEEANRTDADLTFLRTELAQLRAQLAAGEKEMARLTGIESRLAAVTPVLQQHEALLTSLSWRITRPLRAVSERLRRR